MDKLTVVAADIGSIKQEKFGWWSDCGEKGKDICKLADFVARKLRAGRCVALGFECPLWVPVRDEPKELLRARCGEGDRAFAAMAGPMSLVTGLTQVPWLLRAIRAQTSGCHIPVFLQWSDFWKAPRGLFLWEAFVTNKKSQDSDAPVKDATEAAVTNKTNTDPDPHVRDAEKAVKAFHKAVDCNDPISKIKPKDGEPVFSLIGAALLWAGWSTDTKLLCTPCCGVGPNPR